MQTKRLAYASVVLLAIVAFLSIQPWFEVDLSSGTDLRIEGSAVYPAVPAALFVDLLAILIFFYLQSKWGALFLVASSFALIWSFIPAIAVFLGADASALEPFIAKSTGIANWVAQLDEVVMSHQTTFSGLSAAILATFISALQVYTAAAALKRVTSQVKGRSAAKTPSATKNRSKTDATEISLWDETNPKHK